MMESVSTQNAGAKLLVCERSGRWAAALRRELAADGLRVVELRSLDDCRQELTENPASFIVVEFKKNIRVVLRFMAETAKQFPRARFAAAASYPSAECAAAFCEAGAIYVLQSPRDAKLLSRFARRHFSLLPPLRQSMAERIRSRLPWSDRRSAAGH